MSTMKDLLIIVRDQLDLGLVTISELASSCDCSREYIYKLLRGDSQPTITIAEKLANAVDAEITVKMKKRKKMSA